MCAINLMARWEDSSLRICSSKFLRLRCNFLFIFEMFLWPILFLVMQVLCGTLNLTGLCTPNIFSSQGLEKCPSEKEKWKRKVINIGFGSLLIGKEIASSSLMTFRVVVCTCFLLAMEWERKNIWNHVLSFKALELDKGCVFFKGIEIGVHE